MSTSREERRKLVKKTSKLSVVRQCELLDIHRSGVYYEPVGETPLNLELMELIDQKNLLHPWLGVPRITTWLQRDMGYHVNKKRIERLFRLMGLSATGPNPNTSKRGKGELHRIYKYLLKDLEIERCDQVWAMDITYIPVQGGYLYLCAIIDLYSRYDGHQGTRHPGDLEHRSGEPVHGP
jgi:putative transposase